jgi:hypothetical protein
MYIPGGAYFFTVVTFDRIPIFINPQSIELLLAAGTGMENVGWVDGP